MCADLCPMVHLCISLIYLMEIREPSSNPESHLILLFSASTSGLCEIGMYSIITVITLSFTTDMPPNSFAKMVFSLLSHCMTSGLFSSRMTHLLCSFLALMTLRSFRLWVECMIVFVRALLALATSSCSVSLCILLVSTIRSLLISICLS